MKPWILTKHAEQRLQERDLPHPNNVRFAICSKTTRRKLVKCGLTINPKCIYMQSII